MAFYVQRLNVQNSVVLPNNVQGDVENTRFRSVELRWNINDFTDRTRIIFQVDFRYNQAELPGMIRIVMHRDLHPGRFGRRSVVSFKPKVADFHADSISGKTRGGGSKQQKK